MASSAACGVGGVPLQGGGRGIFSPRGHLQSERVNSKDRADRKSYIVDVESILKNDLRLTIYELRLAPTCSFLDFKYVEDVGMSGASTERIAQILGRSCRVKHVRLTVCMWLVHPTFPTCSKSRGAPRWGQPRIVNHKYWDSNRCETIYDRGSVASVEPPQRRPPTSLKMFKMLEMVGAPIEHDS